MDYPVIIKSTVHLEDSLQIELPVIYTSDGLLKSYLEYLVEYKYKSSSWVDASAHAILLLVEFTEFNQYIYEYPADLFKTFSNKLFSGTVDIQGEDVTGLRWKPREIPNANKIISYVSQFSDWLCNEKDLSHKANLNPWRKATTHEQRLNWAAYSHRISNAFLAHIWSKDTANDQNKRSRHVRYEQDDSDQNYNHALNRFPDRHINNLIDKGFLKPRCLPSAPIYKKLELRDILITILMHFGGLRVSEPFHLWLQDIIEDPETPGSALVTVYHPQNGHAPLQLTDGRVEMRTTTLAKNWGRIPRNKIPKSKKAHAGWKKNKLSSMKGNFMVVHWFEPSAGIMFWFYYKLYLQTQYVEPDEFNKHPYAFTKSDGQPYTINAFTIKHKAALENIGLIVSKDLGTSPHGHRYAYENRLEEAGVGKIYIGNAMHHKSIKSQDTYESKSPRQMREVMNRLESKVHNKLSLTLNDIDLNKSQV